MTVVHAMLEPVQDADANGKKDEQLVHLPTVHVPHK